MALVSPARATRFLTHRGTCREHVDRGAVAVLREHGVEPVDVAWKLSLTLPRIISTAFNPSASNAVLNATMHDLSEEIRKAEPLVVPPTEEFLQKRARMHVDRFCSASAAHLRHRLARALRTSSRCMRARSPRCAQTSPRA